MSSSTKIFTSPLNRLPLDFKKLKKILIIRNDRLGDVVLTLPMASLLKQTYPHLEIHFMLREYTAPLAAQHSSINKIILLPDDLKNSENYAKTLAAIKSEHYDLAIVVHSKNYLAKLIWDAKIPLRMGSLYRAHSWRYNCWIKQKRKHSLQHEADYNIDIIRPYVNVPSRDQLSFDLHYSEAAKTKVQHFLAQHNIQAYSIIHPGSGGSAVNLPLDTYAKLIATYHFPGTIIITGAPAEKSLFATVAQNAKQKIVDAIGEFSLDELMYLIAHCEILLTNSTGPLHIARAFKRKLLGFYPTTVSCHPRRWGPYAQEETHTVLPPHEHYAIASHNSASQTAMDKISVDDIIKKLDTII